MRRRIIILCVSIFLLAVTFVIGSRNLIKQAEEKVIPPLEEQITIAEIEHLLSDADDEYKQIFLNRCKIKLEEQGYLLRTEETENLITYIKEAQPELQLDERKLDVICVSDNSILVQHTEEEIVSTYQIKQMQENQTVIRPGDSLHTISTADTIFKIMDTEKTKILLQATWIKANTQDKLTVKYGEEEFCIDNMDSSYSGYEDIADLMIAEGGVTEVSVYTDKINARLLSIKQQGIELEGIGILPYTEDIQVYKLFGEYEPYTLSDLKIGYAFTDFVLNDKKEVVAALVSGEGYLDKIRVVVKTTGFESAYHEEVVLSCDTDMEWKSGEKYGVIESGEQVRISSNSEMFDHSRITLTPVALSAETKVHSVERNQGVPAYRGVLEVEKTEEGLLIINELSLDEYLYSVVPSEMPASYPLEALKAQAVSARTYAYAHMLSSRLHNYGAHVDDSAAFQVYNNIMENEATTRAVRETEGVIVTKNNVPVTTYFYSTSCGYGTDLTAWMSENDSYLCSKKIGEGESLELSSEEAFGAYIRQRDESCYEAEDSYFRWKYATPVNEELLLENLKKRYKANPQQILTKTADGFIASEIDKFGTLQGMEIEKRAPGGAVTQLLLVGSEATIRILSEKNVRYILAGESTKLFLGKDYTKEGKANGMLPSAFLTINPEIKKVSEDVDADVATSEKEKIVAYEIYGGGFGHGIGMSQNGARRMADRGMPYDEILRFFYVETDLREMKKEEK